MKTKLLFHLFCILFSTIIVVSCNQKKEQVSINIKYIYYKEYSKKDSLMGFALRKYEFNKDTIRESFLSINLTNKVTNKYSNTFIKKGESLYILSNVKDDNTKCLYFKPTAKDTCFFIQTRLDSYYICSKGKVNFKDNKNSYKINYDQHGYDTTPADIILNKDYTVLEMEYKGYFLPRKEIIVKDTEIGEDVKLKLEKATKEIMWW